jgi:hypothetical protein
VGVLEFFRLDFYQRIGFLCLIFNLFLALPALAAGENPALDGMRVFPRGWHVRVLVDKRLAGNTDAAGRWETYELRSPSGGLALVQFLSGTETGGLYIPDSLEEKLDGPLGMGATYKVFSEGPLRAICETHPYLGSTITAAMPSGSTVVLESKTLSIGAMLELLHLLFSPPVDDENYLEPLFVVP